jgi:hypothetical protein
MEHVRDPLETLDAKLSTLKGLLKWKLRLFSTVITELGLGCYIPHHIHPTSTRDSSMLLGLTAIPT